MLCWCRAPPSARHRLVTHHGASSCAWRYPDPVPARRPWPSQDRGLAPIQPEAGSRDARSTGVPGNIAGRRQRHLLASLVTGPYTDRLDERPPRATTAVVGQYGQLLEVVV